jgi:branched-chain amino acid transport system substrate-binding protein
MAACLSVGSATADEVVKFALIDPMSGSFAATGRLGEQHFRFAMDRINASGAAGPGRTFELVVLDNEVSPEKSLVLLRKAVDDGVRYITQGNGSSVAFALTDAIAKNNKRDPARSAMFLNYAAVDPALTNDKCNWWHFRFDADSDMKMRAMAAYILSRKDLHKVYVFNQDYSFGQSVERGAKDMLTGKRDDLAIVGAERVPLGKVKDFAPYIQKMQAAGADAVVTGNWGADLALLVKAANDSGFKGTFFTYYLGATEVVTEVGQAGKGDAQISEWHANVDALPIEEMAAAFEAKYHQAFYYWRIVNMLDMTAAAMKQANSSDPALVGKALAGMNFKNPLGDVSMRADNHQLLQPMFISVLEPGVKHVFPEVNMGFRTIGRIEPEQTRMATTCSLANPS